MNKKFLTAFLFGATLLASTSTFVSCKDYDDDIKSVKNDLNAEVTARKALETKVAAAESAIASLQEAQKALEAKLADYELKADHLKDIADLTAQIDALKKAQAALEAVVNTNGNDIKALLEADKKLVEADAALEAAIALKADKADLDSTNAALEQTKKDLGDLVAKYNTLSDDLAATKADLTKKITALEAQDAVLEKLINDGDAALKALIEANSSAIQNNASAIQNNANGIKDNAAAIKAVKDEVVALATALKAADKALDEKIDALANDLNGKFDEINGTVAGLKHDVTSMKSDIESLKASVKGHDKDIEDLGDKIKEVSDKIETMSAMLSDALRSLVFIPNLYVDGIEATRYRVLRYTNLIKSADYATKRKREGETYEKTISKINDYRIITPGSVEKSVAPVWPIKYHLNPSSAATAYEDLIGFSVQEADVITRAKGLKVVTDPKFFENKNGILTVGVKVENPDLLLQNGPTAVTDGQTGKISEGKDNIIALQAKAPEGKTVTSDYSMLYATLAKIEGIVWKDNVGQTREAGLANKVQDKPLSTTDKNSDELREDLYGTQDNLGGEIAGKSADYVCGKHIHVWDTPEEALLDNTNNLVELYYKNEAGIALENYLGVHWYDTNLTGTQVSSVKTWYFKGNDANMAIEDDLANYGVSYSFEFVDYVIDSNSSIDSRYAEIDAATGTVKARNVDDKGNTIENSATSVGREPLVRVMLKIGNDVVKDGYILVRITDKDIVTPEKTLEVEIAGKNQKFDLCNGVEVEMLNWSQFSKFILTDKLDNMKKEDFDRYYGPQADPSTITRADANAGYKEVGIIDDPNGNYVWPTLMGCADGDWMHAEPVVGGGYKFKADVYESIPNAAKTRAVAKPYGTVWYFHNESNTTNEKVVWELSAEELEAITHDANWKEEGSTYSVYIRWTGHNGAPYRYIYLKLTLTITREGVATYAISEKIDNYWFGTDGSKDGWDAIVLNAPSPIDGKNTTGWDNTIRSTFKLNEVFLTNADATALINVGVDANASTEDRSNLSISTIAGIANKGKVAKVAKYFFTPEATEITALNGKKYTISPKKSAGDALYNKLIPYYPAEPINESHVWASETAANDIISKCAIDFEGGVFNNVELYAEYKGGYTRIATLNPETGRLALDRNDVTYDVLNAIGYEGTNHENISKELRAKVGVISYDLSKSCKKIAAQMSNSTFLASWQRPINILDVTPQVVLDANSNANYIYLADILQLFDWRGYMLDEAGSQTDAENVRGCMELKSTKWLWAYYGVNQITVDCTPSKVYTNMHGLDITKTTLADVDPNYAYVKADDEKNNVHEYNFDLSAWNSSAKSADLYNKFKTDAAFRKALGYIYYDNNGDNVNEFDVIVPITVSYDWGSFTKMVKIHIKDTLGNADAKKR